jgi:hypothetical protein
MNSCQFSQPLVSQRPVYDQARKRKRRNLTAKSKSGILRPDKRWKAKYL